MVLRAGTRFFKTIVLFPEPEIPVTTVILPLNIPTSRKCTMDMTGGHPNLPKEEVPILRRRQADDRALVALQEEPMTNLISAKTCTTVPGTPLRSHSSLRRDLYR